MKRLYLRYRQNFYYLGVEYSVLLIPFAVCYSTQLYVNDEGPLWWAPMVMWALVAILASVLPFAFATLTSIRRQHASDVNNGGRILSESHSFPYSEIIIAIDGDYEYVGFVRKKRIQGDLSLSVIFVFDLFMILALIVMNKLTLIGIVSTVIIYLACLFVFGFSFSPLHVTTREVLGEKEIAQRMEWENVV